MRRILTVLAAAVLVLTACGGDELSEEEREVVEELAEFQEEIENAEPCVEVFEVGTVMQEDPESVTCTEGGGSDTITPIGSHDCGAGNEIFWSDGFAGAVGEEIQELPESSVGALAAVCAATFGYPDGSDPGDTEFFLSLVPASETMTPEEMYAAGVAACEAMDAGATESEVLAATGATGFEADQIATQAGWSICSHHEDTVESFAPPSA